MHNITGTLLQVSKSWLFCSYAVDVGMLPMLCLQIPRYSELILLLSMILSPYDIYERYIYINAGTNDDVVLNCIFRVDAQYWPPAFALWVICRMASVLALSVTRKACC